jgi:hypothetical protein
MDFRSGKIFLNGLYLLSVFCQRSGLSLLVSQAANVEIEDAFESAIAFLKNCGRYRFQHQIKALFGLFLKPHSSCNQLLRQ